MLVVRQYAIAILMLNGLKYAYVNQNRFSERIGASWRRETSFGGLGGQRGLSGHQRCPPITVFTLLTPYPPREFERDDFRKILHGTRAHGLQRPRTTSPSVTKMTV